MGLFEENPWLLVPIIILTVEVWSLFKSLVRTTLRRRTRQESGQEA